MAASSRGFRLVVYEHHLDPHIFRDIVADSLKLHPTDAMRLVSHAPGVIPFPMTRRRARWLGEKLASVGVNLAVWPVKELPDLSKPCPVHKVDLRSDGLETFGMRGEPLHWVSWPLVELISVGELPQGAKELSLDGPTWLSASAGAMRAMVMGYRHAGTQVRRTIESAAPELWIVRRRPIQAIRIQQERTNYEYLGDRRAPSTRANFRMLVEDAVRLAPHATSTPATQSFLTYDRPGKHSFASAQQFMEYTAWQLLVRWRDRPEPDDLEHPVQA